MAIMEKLVCNLASGKWGPPKSSGSVQTESVACITAKDQRNPGVFTREEKEQISQAVRKKYAEVALSAQGKFKYETGKKGAGVLGYEPDILVDMPDDLLESFCGVGNPFSIWKITATWRTVHIKNTLREQCQEYSKVCVWSKAPLM